MGSRRMSPFDLVPSNKNLKELVDSWEEELEKLRRYESKNNRDRRDG